MGCELPTKGPNWIVRPHHFKGEPPGELAQGRGALLTGESAVLGLLHQCSRAAVDGYGRLRIWTPAASDIEELERLLPAFLLSPDARPPAPLRIYYRQYGGYVANGHRFIYASFIPEGVLQEMNGPDEWPKHDWKREPIRICDGGPVFWGISFDVDQRTFSGMDFNERI